MSYTRYRQPRVSWLRRIAVVAAAAIALTGGAFAATRGVERARDAVADAAPPATATEPDAAPAPRRRISIAAVGDIALNGVPPAGIFASVSRLLDADVTLGNLEGTLSVGGVSKCAGLGPKARERCFAFQAPPAYAGALRAAGFTVLNLANNHAADFGPSALGETQAALSAADLGIAGAGTRPYRARVRGVRVTVLGFAPLAPGWDLRDAAGAAELVRRASVGDGIVVVTMHAGAEGTDAAHVRPGAESYLGEDRGDVMAFAHAVVDAGAVLVGGQGPHVLRGMEWYRGRLIAYSLGNFASNGVLNVSGDGGVSALLSVTLARDGRWIDGRLVAVRLDRPGIPRPDPLGAARRSVQRLSQEDFGRRGVRIDPDGRILAPRASRA